MAALDASAHIEDQLAQVVGGGAVGDLAGDQGGAPDVLGGLDESGGGLKDLLRAELLDLLLGVLELAEHARDLLGELLGAALDQLLELGDDRVLPGEEVVRVHADEGLDTAHSGADGGLAEQLHQTQAGRCCGRACRRTAPWRSRRW